jgi:2-polyprenyl-3-methyl-5-hydroxy-6-metoxy-1,4-benzoquinol methylase
MSERKQHWENVYETKSDDEVSWYEETPATSLSLITDLNLNKDAVIIDVGGGNSNLIGKLQQQGFSKLSVLDISKKALERTKYKLEQKAEKIQWIVSDILDFQPNQQYDLWHDRAVFHFLTQSEDIDSYVELVSQSVKKNGYFILATFSKSGPLKCSGLKISQYDKETLLGLFNAEFNLIKSFEEVHHTPFNSEQNFIYNLFQKK